MEETRSQQRYRLNINGLRDKVLLRGKIRCSRDRLLKSLPTEELLKEVGYYD